MTQGLIYVTILFIITVHLPWLLLPWREHLEVYTVGMLGAKVVLQIVV